MAWIGGPAYLRGMDKQVPWWVLLPFAVALIAFGGVLVRVNPWARGGTFLIVGGLIFLYLAFTDFRRRRRNAQRS